MKFSQTFWYTYGGLNMELVRTLTPSGILPYFDATWMERFAVSSCEDVNSWICTQKLIYTWTQPIKLFAIDKFETILSSDTFSILYLSPL